MREKNGRWATSLNQRHFDVVSGVQRDANSYTVRKDLIQKIVPFVDILHSKYHDCQRTPKW